MLRMWFLTVFSLMNSSRAISRLLSPRATSSQHLELAVGERGAARCVAQLVLATDQAANSVRSFPAIAGLISRLAAVDRADR